MSFFNSLLVADMTAAGKNITACHFQIIVNGFQPVFHIHWFFVKGAKNEILNSTTTLVVEFTPAQ